LRDYHLRGEELGSVEPFVTMASGMTPSWDRHDPRAQLTNVAALTYQQSHPGMNGSVGGFSFMKWLRGEY
jgi:hypothetical protein